MVRIVNSKELKSFYENSMKKQKINRERLTKPSSNNFKKFLEKVQYKKNSKVLDLGYGFGNYSIELAKKKFNVISIDYISTKYFKDRIKNLKISRKIKIIKKDLNKYFPKERYYIILTKDILHMLSKKKVIKILKKMIKSTEVEGYHYITIFTDIKRKFKNGEKIVIENEADFSEKEFIKIIKELYKRWDLKIKSRAYKELNHQVLERPYNFFANNIIVIAHKIK